MDNILTYLAWRGDLSFAVSPFNEVDNLIFSELAYTKMEEIAPGPDTDATITLTEVCEAYQRLGYQAPGNSNDAFPLLEKAAVCPRYSGVRLGAYVNQIDPEKELQFSAVSFFLDDGSAYVAFRGTDNTIVGWREDFTISYLSETPGQYEAVRYLNQIASRTDRPLWVGGHSKGGNLAVYAAAFCEEAVKPRIRSVFSNDGPGFNQSVTETENYQRILDKVHLIIPESSVIGILLSNKKERKIVDSSAAGAQQHDPYTWLVERDHLKASSQTQTSQFLDETLRRWLEELDNSQRENLVKAIFDSMDAVGVQTLTELNENRWNSYNTILKAALEMDPELQRDVMKTAQKLALAGRDVLWEEAQTSLRGTVSQIAEKWKLTHQENLQQKQEHS